MGFFGNKPNLEQYDDDLNASSIETNTSDNTKISEETLFDLAIAILAEYTTKSGNAIATNMAHRNADALNMDREKMLPRIREEMLKNKIFPEYGINRVLDEAEKDKIIELIDSRQFRYGILDPFIADPSVSDIKTYSYNNIRIKRNGKRMDAGVTFRSEKDYEDWCNRILQRNGINFGTANADQTFTDASQPSARLRISAISNFLTDNEIPCFAIRKIPKQKMTVDTLVDKGMFEKEKRHVVHKLNTEDGMGPEDFVPTNPSLNDLIPKLVRSSGILFTGKGASGKTSFMNALLELVPKDESIMLCQENPELFMDNHPDCLATHVVINKAENVVSYSLGALTRMALLVDLDRIIVGEIKQPDEAEGLSKASMTGHKCWTSVHGNNCRMGINKMADYISAATGYDIKSSLSQLQGFEYVVYMENFQICEIVHIKGWDREAKELILEDVYKVDVA